MEIVAFGGPNMIVVTFPVCRFNVSMYPTSKSEFVVNTWVAKAKQRSEVKLKELVSRNGKEGIAVVDRLFKVLRRIMNLRSSSE